MKGQESDTRAAQGDIACPFYRLDTDSQTATAYPESEPDIRDRTRKAICTLEVRPETGHLGHTTMN